MDDSAVSQQLSFLSSSALQILKVRISSPRTGQGDEVVLFHSSYTSFTQISLPCHNKSACAKKQRTSEDAQTG